MNWVHFHNGQWYTKEQLTISPFDVGFLRSYGIFDVIRVYNNRPFYPEHHIGRFLSSAREMGLSPVPTAEDVHSLIADGVSRNNTRGGNGFYDIRMVLSGGVGEDTMSLGIAQFLLLFAPGTVYPASWYREGIAVKTISMERHIPHIKSSNYFLPMYERQSAKPQGYNELLLIDRHENVTEGATSNVFFVRNGVVITPPDSIVAGVTRLVTVKLARELGISVEERPVALSEAFSADECYITGTSKHIVPVRKINTTEFVAPGTVTAQLMKAYEHHVEEYSSSS